jgi:hypothetical protein
MISTQEIELSQYTSFLLDLLEALISDFPPITKTEKMSILISKLITPKLMVLGIGYTLVIAQLNKKLLLPSKDKIPIYKSKWLVTLSIIPQKNYILWSVPQLKESIPLMVISSIQFLTTEIMPLWDSLKKLTPI